MIPRPLWPAERRKVVPIWVRTYPWPLTPDEVAREREAWGEIVANPVKIPYQDTWSSVELTTPDRWDDPRPMLLALAAAGVGFLLGLAAGS